MDGLTLVVVGYGYTSRAFVARERARFARVVATSRQPFDAEGVESVAFDGTIPPPALVAALAEADALLVSAPPDAEGDPTLRVLAEAIASAPRLRWIGYLSTVGVYGDAGGAWIDESFPGDPMNERSRQRLVVERAWLALGQRSAKPVQIFRLSGIYGPGRNAIQNLRTGKARRIVKAGQVFNRIHVDDIASALAVSLDRPEPGAIYNVTDDEPAPPQDVVAHAAELLGVAPPPEIAFETADLTPMARSFYGECKRVSNRLIKQRLGWTPLYPTYREGLRAVLAAMDDPASRVTRS